MAALKATLKGHDYNAAFDRNTHVLESVTSANRTNVSNFEQ